MSNAVYRLIDVSKHNGKIDFGLVRSAGIEGVIIRAGYGIESPKQIDPCFERYYNDAKAAGLYVGAYHYSYAKSAEAAEAEADFMLKILKRKSFELPIYGDFEEQSECSKAVCNTIVTAFCNKLEAAGAWAGIYSYDTFFKDKLSAEKVKRYTAWVARVENVFPQCVSSSDIGIWQNSWKGKIPGIRGDVDTDYCFRDFPMLIQRAGLNRF